MSRVPVETPVLKKNDEIAAENRSLFARGGVVAVNIMSAPGAGKTTLLEATLPRISSLYRASVIEGDLQTSLDADRIHAIGVPAHQVNTKLCHLDASLVRSAYDTFAPGSLDVLFIENIGNLVCPASYDLGEHIRITVFSVPEGADKPKKYPRMFHQSDCVILNKVDLLPFCGVSLDQLMANVRDVSPKAAIFPLSCRTGAGLDPWVAWLIDRIAVKR
jgi:hydrogenase nickel incorporation protein HypB